jgi:hypothetical protein
LECHDLHFGVRLSRPQRAATTKPLKLLPLVCAKLKSLQ